MMSKEDRESQALAWLERLREAAAAKLQQSENGATRTEIAMAEAQVKQAQAQADSP